MKKLFLLAIFSAFLPALASAQAEQEIYYGHMGWGWNGGGMHWSGWITMVLFWLLLVVAIMALLKWMDKNK